MHTVFSLLCFVVVIHWLIFPYPSGLLHWHCGNLTIAPVPAKQPRWIWINTSCEFIMNDCKTTTKQSTTKPCAYFLGYTVYDTLTVRRNGCHFTNYIVKCIFMNEKFCIFIWMLLTFVPKGGIYKKKSALVQVMIWHWTGNTPLSEPMMVEFTDAYTCNLDSIIQGFFLLKC